VVYALPAALSAHLGFGRLRGALRVWWFGAGTVTEYLVGVN